MLNTESIHWKFGERLHLKGTFEILGKWWNMSQSDQKEKWLKKSSLCSAIKQNQPDKKFKKYL